MVALTFPDGARREYPKGTTGLDIAKGISPSLAKRTVAMALDGVLTDLSDPIEFDPPRRLVEPESPHPDSDDLLNRVDGNGPAREAQRQQVGLPSRPRDKAVPLFPNRGTEAKDLPEQKRESEAKEPVHPSRGYKLLSQSVS